MADPQPVEGVSFELAVIDGQPAWSATGGAIAFTCGRSGDFDAYLMRPDGSDVRSLTAGWRREC